MISEYTFKMVVEYNFTFDTQLPLPSLIFKIKNSFKMPP